MKTKTLHFVFRLLGTCLLSPSAFSQQEQLAAKSVLGTAGMIGGASAADHNVSNRIYALHLYGEPFVNTIEEEYLARNYQVSNCVVAGCVVALDFAAETDEYNQRLMALLNEKHGRDIFAEAERFREDVDFLGSARLLGSEGKTSRDRMFIMEDECGQKRTWKLGDRVADFIVAEYHEKEGRLLLRGKDDAHTNFWINSQLAQ